jgi:hypothetical protein
LRSRSGSQRSRELRICQGEAEACLVCQERVLHVQALRHLRLEEEQQAEEGEEEESQVLAREALKGHLERQLVPNNQDWLLLRARARSEQVQHLLLARWKMLYPQKHRPRSSQSPLQLTQKQKTLKKKKQQGLRKPKKTDLRMMLLRRRKEVQLNLLHKVHLSRCQKQQRWNPQNRILKNSKQAFSTWLLDS